MSIFADLLPGDVIDFTDVTPKKCLDLVRNWQRVTGEKWEFDWWTAPACRAEDVQVRRVWLARVDGLTETQRDELRRRYIDPSDYAPTGGKTHFLVDGRLLPPDSAVPRTSKHGWEHFQVGQRRVFQMRTEDLHRRLVQTVRRRKLDWLFECNRLTDMEEPGDKVPKWLVRRTR